MKKRQTACFAMAMGMILCGVGTVSAELIFLKNGRVIRSNIKKVTPIYIRTTVKDKNGRNEYLVDEIYKIEPDKTQEHQISELAIENIRLRQANEINRKLRKAALEKAAEIVGQAVAEINMSDLEEMPEDVRSAAIEVANQLVLEAMSSADTARMPEQSLADTRPGEQDFANETIDRAAENIAVVQKKVISAPAVKSKPIQIKPVTAVKSEEQEQTVQEGKNQLIYSDDQQSIYEIGPDETIEKE